VTVDGAKTGEIVRQQVSQRYEYPAGGYTGCANFKDYTIRCNLYLAHNPSGATNCVRGDSGGPVYERVANNQVYAAGTIIGGQGPDCYYLAERQMLKNAVNGELLTPNGPVSNQ
jgi:hypothetical protein